MVDLDRAKSSLCEALREKTPQYWDLMKNWYKQKIAKEEFDRKAKVLLGEAGIQLHNDFLFSILIKCHTVSHSDLHLPTSSSGRKIGQGIDRGSVKRPKLDPTPIKDITPFGAFNERKYMVCGKDLDRILMCSHELLLPDLPTLHMRMLLLAWECGLDGATEDTALYISRATQVFIVGHSSACTYTST